MLGLLRLMARRKAERQEMFSMFRQRSIYWITCLLQGHQYASSRPEPEQKPASGHRVAHTTSYAGKGLYIMEERHQSKCG